ncbi:hypothetical protein FB45DRAFT_934273 [Roridomyces roridus]|uniref:Uncharacterized protein n=1 Tax=Roridomyces roridus TaxID=1738132 RepID=A0AAD7BC82_9AGAR|nr:hypothetical protein FB45DRAFT_934273 [Roridomyces roridus]
MKIYTQLLVFLFYLTSAVADPEDMLDWAQQLEADIASLNEGAQGCNPSIPMLNLDDPWSSPNCFGAPCCCHKSVIRSLLRRESQQIEGTRQALRFSRYGAPVSPDLNACSFAYIVNLHKRLQGWEQDAARRAQSPPKKRSITY